MTLPNFLVVGAAKSGTTSLYYYLKQHPEIYMPDNIKETFFFSSITAEQFSGPGNKYARTAITSLQDYEKLFELAGSRKAIGEACVAYLYYYQTSIEKILKLLGREIKIIIALRNPVDRAYSNYLHHLRENWEPLSFVEATTEKVQNQRKQDGWWWGFEYLPVSFYYEQVKAYIDIFGKERVLVILHDDLVSDAQVAIEKIFRFLAVDPSFIPDTTIRHNVSLVPRNKKIHSLLSKPNFYNTALRKVLPKKFYKELFEELKNRNLIKPPKLSMEDRIKLMPVFREDIFKLQDLIQRDLSSWSELN
jgi:hypothetical protein